MAQPQASPGTLGGDHAPALAYPDHAAPPVGGYLPPPASPGRLAALAARLAVRTPGWAAPAAVLACLAGASGFVLATDPTDAAPVAQPTCLVKLLTGYDCPGCGGTRSFYYLLQANLPAAARHHAVFVFAVPFLLYLYVAWAVERVSRRRLPALRLSPAAIGGVLAVWLIFSVLRNLPWAPFTSFYV